jgi:CheY-like chemotaxis protein
MRSLARAHANRAAALADLRVVATLDAMQEAENRWVLLVDDHDDGREMLSEFLSFYGLTVEGCASAEEALCCVARRGAPMLVITDLSLQRMSGIDLARALRQLGLAASTPILAVTGHVAFEDPERLFTEVLLKPVPLEALTAAVGRALACATPSSTEAVSDR